MPSSAYILTYCTFGVAQEKVRQVKYDVYTTITLLHSRLIRAEGQEPPYPHLHTLLTFDTQVRSESQER